MTRLKNAERHTGECLAELLTFLDIENRCGQSHDNPSNMSRICVLQRDAILDSTQNPKFGGC